MHLLRRGSDEVTTVGPASKDVVADALWDTVSPLLGLTTNSRPRRGARSPPATTTHPS